MDPFIALLALVYVFTTVLCASATRFRVLIRNYVLASLVLAAIILLAGYRTGSMHLLYLGLFVIIGKVLLVPMAIDRILGKEVSAKLEGHLRPAFLRSLSVLTIAGILAAIVANPSKEILNPNFMMIFSGGASFVVALLGILFTRNIYAQLVGILMVENALSILFLAFGLEIPLAIEIGLIATALIATMILAILGKAIKIGFGTTATAQLNELSE